MNKISTLGIDLAKRVFQLHGVDDKGHCVLKKRLNRCELIQFISNLPVCIITMEACGGSFFWARKFREMGHTIKLISPQYVKPFVKSNKNDANDAEAIVEAGLRPSMRFVPIKEEWQQEIQILHRVRERLVKSKVAICNEIRGILGEFGIVIPQNISRLKKALLEILNSINNGALNSMQEVFQQMFSELATIESQISFYEKKIQKIFKNNEAAKKSRPEE